jgi:Helicase conserved C-terminal domain/DEAD/DEAH box helicase
MKTTKTAILSSTFIHQFLDYIIDSHSLTIGEYFSQISVDKSFFMLAATGLGKTVALPVYLLYLLLQKLEAGADHLDNIPTIWVVVPKITIAESEAYHLNELWSQFLLSIVTNVDPTKPVLKSDKKEILPQYLFGYRTSNGSKYVDAPIQFITTGILPLIASGDKLDKSQNLVIIDEAHVSLETTEDMEIAITLLKQQGVIVNYMSATVDSHELEERLGTTIISADKARFKNFYHNTGKPMLDCIEEIITKTLIEFDTASEYYPAIRESDLEQHWKIAVLQGTQCFETTKDKPTRSSGLLIAINSQQGEGSDAKAVEQKIHRLCKDHGILVLTFSSKINKDPKLKKRFDLAFERIQRKNLKYIIISTSVIEMGITWPTLDHVATMDSEYETVNLNGYEVLLTVPLGTNALKQRIGRVGRKRAGCGYITKEFGTEYTDLTDEELNGTGLKNQPISFPLSRVAPMKLGYILLRQNLTTQSQIKDYLVKYRFPSLQSPAEIGTAIYKIQKVIYNYGMIGIQPTRETNFEQALALSERWIGDPSYPFILEGFKCLFDDSQYKISNQGYLNELYRYDRFIAWNFMALVLKFPQFKLLREDEKTKAKATTLDLKKSTQECRAVVKEKIIDSSEGTVWTNIDYCELAAVSKLVSIPIRHTSKLDPTSYRGAFTSHILVDEKTIGKFYEMYCLHFLELLKVVKKHKLPILLINYLSGKQMRDYSGFDEDDDEIDALDIYMDPKRSMDTLLHDKLYLIDSSGNILGTSFKTAVSRIRELTSIYGAKITKLTPANEFRSLWNFEAEYQGQTITGILNQEYHYCQFEEGKDYYAFLTPRTIGKDRNTKIIWGLDYLITT